MVKHYLILGVPIRELSVNWYQRKCVVSDLLARIRRSTFAFRLILRCRCRYSLGKCETLHEKNNIVNSKRYFIQFIYSTNNQTLYIMKATTNFFIAYHAVILAFCSFLFSVSLWFTGFEMEGIFVGIWVPSILSLSIVLKQAARNFKNLQKS